MASHETLEGRPSWPKRAVITAGMPYGNKGLHFGHVGGVFIPADFYARFLRDRLGAQNVIFVSGTDCFGSPIMEGYRRRKEAGTFTGSIKDYVQSYHDDQAETLAAFEVSCDLYAGSALEPAAKIHEQMTAEIISRLYDQGQLFKRSTKQFFDPSANQFLNGRQVLGRCPIQGCRSEKAYADECDLGHQYEPEELIAPKSALTGEVPELVPVDNFYFDLPAFLGCLRERVAALADDETTRSVVRTTMEEWLLPPRLHIQVKYRELFEELRSKLPEHTLEESPDGKGSFVVSFPSWRERDQAHEPLREGGVRFRSGKALVPFRITGNIDWGVPVPTLENSSGLTCWVWPESLWAPISFTRTVLALDAEQACPSSSHAQLDWHAWWCSPEAKIFQFIGQDNIYFYGVAQSALWDALGWNMEPTTVVANYHLLYQGKKASSSSETPPPPARELLDRYTAEQLRAHWLSLGLGEKPVSFSPKAFDERVVGKNQDGTPLRACDDKRVIDPVLKEGAMLTGVFNRLARSCFYAVAPKEGSASAVRTGAIPAGLAAQEVVQEVQASMLAFERAMHSFELHRALATCDELLRRANKRWSDAAKATQDAKSSGDQERADELGAAALRDAFYELWVGSVLMHGIVPQGTELICENLRFDPELFFSWDHLFGSLDDLVTAQGEVPGEHLITTLPPRFDFFRKHESQF
ncbi:class I tRNA ligase family protein [Collinsella sp. AGMB00827]|uniref:Class I tRNA ligase family protein n=1 Tax=Collinsella ureilytica TaxID=2869515 RepID=A0ABS7MLT2_9ACTN|nr:class I tRNA ligase family protein [Collinsella urealyticum]MBY4798257.1 class I tRNA ligase family protein [Collinsella urealyticum]